MKKFLSGILAASMLTASAVMVSAADDITVMLDGRQVDFDVAPIIENDRTMVPVRAIFEALGADVQWDEAKQEVDATKDDVRIALTIGSNQMVREQHSNGTVGGVMIALDSPAMITGDRTLVPLRAISEAFGSTVEWVDSTRTVIITSASPATAAPITTSAPLSTEAPEATGAPETPVYTIAPLVGEATDYSKKNNWLFAPEKTDKAVDTFYIYPTVVIDENKPDIVDINDKVMRETAPKFYENSVSAMEDSTNVFAPFYRQTNLMAATGMTGLEYEEFCRQEQRTDIYAALDYYFENYNQGRPFILAGHSQGSCMTKIVLAEYMKAHPDYLERMVAAYPIGFSITESYLKENPHLKFAEGADDTGVIISWNTEGPNDAAEGKPSILVEEGAVSINPINWMRDETYADIKENKGSYVYNEKKKKYEIVSGLADAKVDTGHGTVVVTTSDDFIDIDKDLFAAESFHNHDYDFFYANIKENVETRINSYFKKEAEKKIAPLAGEPSDYSNKDNWIKIPKITKNVDTVYFYPTTFIDTAEDAEKICAIDNQQMREGAVNMYEQQATAYEQSTNVFAPYYRQSNLSALTGFSPEEFSDFQRQEQRTDVYAALDYYFENYNEGRPFILAGHSQGSMMIKIILEEYMDAHPEYLKRMVAAYPIGYGFEQEWYDAHSYVTPAKSANDTGVVVTWNTEGPANKGRPSSVVLQNEIVINPINWKTDDTYAPAKSNLGSRVKNSSGKYTIEKGKNDAQLDTERGVVVCTTNEDFVGYEEIFGPASLHGLDYDLYYANIQENVKTRVNAYLKANK